MCVAPFFLFKTNEGQKIERQTIGWRNIINKNEQQMDSKTSYFATFAPLLIIGTRLMPKKVLQPLCHC